MNSKLLRAFGVVAALVMPVSGLGLLAVAAASVEPAAASTPTYRAEITLNSSKLVCAGTSGKATTLTCTATSTSSTILPTFTITFGPVNATILTGGILMTPVVTITSCKIEFEGTLPLTQTSAPTTTWAHTTVLINATTTTANQNVVISGSTLVCGLIKPFINGHTAAIRVKGANGVTYSGKKGVMTFAGGTRKLAANSWGISKNLLAGSGLWTRGAVANFSAPGKLVAGPPPAFTATPLVVKLLKKTGTLLCTITLGKVTLTRTAAPNTKKWSGSVLIGMTAYAGITCGPKAAGVVTISLTP